MITARLRQKMNERKISAHALEKQAGLKSSAIHNILYGRSKNPSIKIIQAIANALECNISELIEDTPPHHWRPNNGVRPHGSDDHPPAEEKTPWQPKLYLESFEKIHSHLKHKPFSLTKNQILNIVDEVYLYSRKTRADKVDENFAEWLVNKEAVIPEKVH